MIKEGAIFADIDLNFNDKGKLINNYSIKGSVKSHQSTETLSTFQIG